MLKKKDKKESLRSALTMDKQLCGSHCVIVGCFQTPIHLKLCHFLHVWIWFWRGFAKRDGRCKLTLTFEGDIAAIVVKSCSIEKHNHLSALGRAPGRARGIRVCHGNCSMNLAIGYGEHNFFTTCFNVNQMLGEQIDSSSPTLLHSSSNWITSTQRRRRWRRSRQLTTTGEKRAKPRLLNWLTFFLFDFLKITISVGVKKLLLMILLLFLGHRKLGFPVLWACRQKVLTRSVMLLAIETVSILPTKSSKARMLFCFEWVYLFSFHSLVFL